MFANKPVPPKLLPQSKSMFGTQRTRLIFTYFKKAEFSAKERLGTELCSAAVLSKTAWMWGVVGQTAGLSRALFARTQSCEILSSSVRC